MSELGCLRDGHFNNLQVDGRVISGSTTTDINELINSQLQRAFDDGGGNLVGSSINLGTDLSGTQHTVNSADGAINFFNWTSGVKLFSFNIEEQSITLGIPQRSVHGYDIAGDQVDESGKSYIMSLKDSGIDVSSLLIPRNEPWRYHSSPERVFDNYGFEVTFVVEFPDISGVSLAMFGIRDTVDQFSNAKTLSNVRNNYKNFISFVIENDTVDNTKGKLTINLNSESNPGITESIDITNPQGGKISDNEIWEFKISVSQNLLLNAICTYKCLDTLGVENIIQTPEIPIQALSTEKAGRDEFNETGVPYSPFIHCIQSSDLTPIILHSLIYKRDSRVSDIPGGGH